MSSVLSKRVTPRSRWRDNDYEILLASGPAFPCAVASGSRGRDLGFEASDPALYLPNMAETLLPGRVTNTHKE